MDESQTRLYTSYKLIHIKQCSTYSWSILSMVTNQNLRSVKRKRRRRINIFQKYLNIFLGEKWCKISTDNDRCIYNHIYIFYGKGQMFQIIFPELCKMGRFFFAKKWEKFFCSHTGRLLQGIGRAESFQASSVSTVAERSIRIDTHMFNSSAVHETSLMNLVAGDDSTAHITV